MPKDLMSEQQVRTEDHYSVYGSTFAFLLRYCSAQLLEKFWDAYKLSCLCEDIFEINVFLILKREEYIKQAFPGKSICIKGAKASEVTISIIWILIIPLPDESTSAPESFSEKLRRKLVKKESQEML